MQRAVQVKIRLQEDPLRLQLREVMNSISSRGVLKTALNPLGSQQSPCVVFQSWALPLQHFIHHQQAPQYHQYLPFYTFSADYGTPLAFHMFGNQNTVFVKQQIHRLELSCSQKHGTEGSARPPVTPLSLFITLQGFTCEKKV